MASVQTVEAPAAAAAPTVSQSSAPRKRRRRAAATGAAEDCFSCQKRHQRCDRRRPYCTQCLDIGKDCSGYKTTLTWGVGVASRGKLRGLSLPIVNSTQKAAQPAKDNKIQDSSSVKSASASPKSSQHAVKPKLEASSFPMVIPGSTDMVAPTFAPHGHQPTGPIPIATTTHPTWQVPSFHDHHLEGLGAPLKTPPRNEIRPQPLQRIHSFPATANSYDEVVFSAPSTGSVSTFSESDFPSPNEFPPTPEDVPSTEPFINNQLDFFLCGPDTNQVTEQYSFGTPPQQHFAVSNNVGLNLSLQPVEHQCTTLYPTTNFTTAVVPATYCETVPVTHVVPHYSFPTSGVESLGYYCAAELGRYQLPPPLATPETPIRLL